LAVFVSVNEGQIWLHLRDKPDSPLWVMVGNRDKYERMDYGAFRAIVLRLVNKAGIKRRVYPHLFRHTRVTHLLINKQDQRSSGKGLLRMGA
jgi:site-specific recombinase XerD